MEGVNEGRMEERRKTGRELWSFELSTGPLTTLRLMLVTDVLGSMLVA